MIYETIEQTSLLGIAAILIGVGGATLPTSWFVGSIELGVAVVIIIIRGVLAHYGIAAVSKK